MFYKFFTLIERIEDMTSNEIANLLPRLDGQTLELVSTLLEDANKAALIWQASGGNARGPMMIRHRLNQVEREREQRRSAPFVDPHPDEICILQDDTYEPGYPFFDE